MNGDLWHISYFSCMSKLILDSTINIHPYLYVKKIEKELNDGIFLISFQKLTQEDIVAAIEAERAFLGNE